MLKLPVKKLKAEEYDAVMKVVFYTADEIRAISARFV